MEARFSTELVAGGKLKGDALLLGDEVHHPFDVGTIRDGKRLANATDKLSFRVKKLDGFVVPSAVGLGERWGEEWIRVRWQGKKAAPRRNSLARILTDL